MEQSKRDLLLLVSGNGTKILNAHSISANEVDIVKIDEKILAKPKELICIIKSKPYRAVYFGCDSLSTHRFAFIQKSFILLTTGRGAILDENGASSRFSIPKFFLLEIPAFVFELIVSLLVIVIFHIQVLFDKKMLRSRHQ